MRLPKIGEVWITSSGYKARIIPHSQLPTRTLWMTNDDIAVEWMDNVIGSITWPEEEFLRKFKPCEATIIANILTKYED